MRTMMLLMMLAMVPTTYADDDLALRVKVALSLSQSQAAACGECVFDEAEARADAMEQRKPLVLLVGSCQGRGKIAVDAGAVAAIVRQYADSTAARMIVLTPKGDKSGWYINAELPSTATDAELRKAVADAVPEPPKTMPALDWNISAEVKPTVAPVQAAKRYKQVCVGGVCRLVEVTE